MDWSALLHEGEVLRWEAKPAPRCFTFRNWRRSVFGILLLLLAVYWEAVGLSVGAAYSLPFLGWIPVPFIFAGLYLSLGHLLVARLEWDRVFYALTNRRILVRRGLLRRRQLVLELEDLRYYSIRRHGEELASISVVGGDPPVTLSIPCLEYPERLTSVLEAAISASHPESLVLEKDSHRDAGSG